MLGKSTRVWPTLQTKLWGIPPANSANRTLGHSDQHSSQGPWAITMVLPQPREVALPRQTGPPSFPAPQHLRLTKALSRIHHSLFLLRQSPQLSLGLSLAIRSTSRRLHVSDPEITIKYSTTEKSFLSSKKFTVKPGEQTNRKLQSNIRSSIKKWYNK